jgi:transcriptional regulator with XRE-family HTH domain
MLHDELRSARQRAGLSQTELANLSGIPRNQIARAERGENITLDTLRKIVVHLPIEVLPLIEKVDLTVDIFPHPEKVYGATVDAVQQAAAALAAALRASSAARSALASARKSVPMPAADGQTIADIDLGLMFRKLEQVTNELVTFPNTETGPNSEAPDSETA